MKSKDHHQASCTQTDPIIISSPIGDIEIHSCQTGLHLVKQCDANDKYFSPNERCMVKVKLLSGEKMTTPAEECVQWLKAYFNDGIAHQDIPKLCPTILSEGSFRCQVWRTLPKAVPLGKTITYLQLATLCGSPQACRATGSAMSNNPISLLIPCHRVLPSNGAVVSLCGYLDLVNWGNVFCRQNFPDLLGSDNQQSYEINDAVPVPHNFSAKAFHQFFTMDNYIPINGELTSQELLSSVQPHNGQRLDNEEYDELSECGKPSLTNTEKLATVDKQRR